MVSLNGHKILVTRPAPQSEHLCKLITTEGGQPIRLPVIQIVDIDATSTLQDCLAYFNKSYAAIFISANAVKKVMPTLLARHDLLECTRIIGVGKHTADTLRSYGLNAFCPAPPFNSEAILAMPLLEKTMIQGKKIVIFRGEGGREFLIETLRKRGAQIEYMNVYRRIRPSTPTWLANSKLDILTATSVEGLQNLFTMFVGQTERKQIPLVVMSQRVRLAALKLEIKAPIFVAPTASDEGLLAAIIRAAQSIKIDKSDFNKLPR